MSVEEDCFDNNKLLNSAPLSHDKNANGGIRQDRVVNHTESFVIQRPYNEVENIFYIRTYKVMKTQ